MLANLASLKGLAIGVGIAFVVGFSSGFYTKAKFVAADLTAIAVKANQDNVKTVDTVMRKEAEVVAKVAKQDEKIRIIRKEIIKYVPTPPVQPVPLVPAIPVVGSGVLAGSAHTEDKGHVAGGSASAADAALGVCPSGYLPNGAVSLLNDARAGGIALTPTHDDDSARASSSVDQQAFIDNDLEIVGKYHALATRYNELLDYIEGYKKRQRERLGIK